MCHVVTELPAGDRDVPHGALRPSAGLTGAALSAFLVVGRF